MRFFLHTLRNPQDAMPELAGMTPSQRREVWQTATKRAVRRQQVGVTIWIICITVGTVIAIVLMNVHIRGWAGILAFSAVLGASVGLPSGLALRRVIRSLVRQVLAERAGPQPARGPEDGTVWPPAPREPVS